MHSEDVVNGERAKALLNDPTLASILDALENQYVDAWKQTDVSDTEKREWCWSLLTAVEQLRLHLRVMVENGQLAAVHLERNQRSR